MKYGPLLAIGAGAAAVLYYQSQKQTKKQKAAPGPGLGTRVTNRIDEFFDVFRSQEGRYKAEARRRGLHQAGLEFSTKLPEFTTSRPVAMLDDAARQLIGGGPRQGDPCSVVGKFYGRSIAVPGVYQWEQDEKGGASLVCVAKVK